MRQTDILGVILAGGHSSRFGEDKALARLAGQRLIDHVAARAAPQVGLLAVSGRDYGLGVPVIPDTEAGQGPLGGLLSAARWAGNSGFEAVATFSCDAPFFPLGLVQQLAGALQDQNSCCYVCSHGISHPVFGLWRTSATANLQRIFDGGLRSLKAAASRLDGVSVDFAGGRGPQNDMFFNINRPEDMVVAQHWLAASEA